MWNIASITGRAGYGGVFALTKIEHLNVVIAAQTQEEGSRNAEGGEAARDSLAGYVTLHRMK